MLDARRVSWTVCVPEDLEQAVLDGVLHVDGVTVRDGLGRVVRHLIPTSPAALAKLAAAFPSLGPAAAGVALLATAGLAMSAVGYVALSRRLDSLHEDLDTVLQQIQEVSKGVETAHLKLDELLLMQRSEKIAAVKAATTNLDRAIRIGDRESIMRAVENLTGCQEYFKAIVEALTKFPEAAYQDCTPLATASKAVLVTGLFVAQAMHHMGHDDEAELELDSLADWHSNFVRVLVAPINQSPPPLWLGNLDREEVEETRRFLDEHRSVPKALSYNRARQAALLEMGIGADLLDNASEGDILVIAEEEVIHSDRPKPT